MTVKTSKLRDAITIALTVSASALVMPAFAQDASTATEGQQDSQTTELDRIEVTGSRIPQASTETAQPVMTLSREQIQKTGFTNVSDIVQNISAAGAPAISRASPLTVGENIGGAYVSLRSLGPQRTLVLVDGKRMGVSSDGYADLASIPTSAVERIEVLTDGASAIYGSDAIAGVVNIITRKNFDGFEASVNYGQFTKGDGETQTVNFLLGATGERSAITFGGEFSDQDPVMARDRIFSAFPSGRYHPTVGWNNNSDKGLFFPDGGPENGLTRLEGQTGLNPGTDFREYTPGYPDATNGNSQMMVQSGVKRRSLFANGSFDITDTVRFKADALYSHREGTMQVAGYPFSRTLSADSGYNPWGNNPLGVDPPPAAGSGQDVGFIRRTSEVPRLTEAELATYRFSAGLEGSFDIADKPWDWNVGYLYNLGKGSQRGTGNLFYPNVDKALGATTVGADGALQCADPDDVAAGCVPWNPTIPYGQVGPGGLTGNTALQNYLYLTSHDTSEAKTEVYSANLSGVLAELPAGDLALAAGYEHRKESGWYEPDAMKQSGLSTDLAGAPTSGGYSLDEFYAELYVPILADKPFAKELSVNVAGRYSDYDTFGDTTNGKFSLKWKPFEDLLLRGTYSTGFRAPAIADMYGGESQSFDSYTDPCDTLFGIATRNPAILASCNAGVEDVPGTPAGYRQIAAGGVPAANPNSQSNEAFLSQSNPNLQPENSKSYSYGLVYSPQFAPGLDFSLDWWKINIENVISYQTINSILNNCYVLGVTADCGLFTRDPESGEVLNAVRSATNAGYQTTAGYDLGVRYRTPETAVGTFTFNLQATYVDYLETKADNIATTPVEQLNGWGDGSAYFRTRGNLSADWAYGDVGLTWTTRYYGGLKEPCAFSLGNAEENIPPGGPECDQPNFTSVYSNETPLRTTGSNVFHDLQFRVNAPWNATVALGMNNVFDHEPTQMYSQPDSNFSFYGGFDIGRYYYMKYTQRF